MGSLNEKTLDDLKQKVVVLFTQAGLDAVSSQGYTAATGIWGCKSLTKGGSYSSTYDGLQYIGKGAPTRWTARATWARSRPTSPSRAS